MTKTARNVVGWTKFVLLMAGEINDLLRALFARHGGNVDAAKEDIRFIRDHGQQLENFEAEISKRMDALKERERAAALAAAGEGGTPE